MQHQFRIKQRLRGRDAARAVEHLFGQHVRMAAARDMDQPVRSEGACHGIDGARQAAVGIGENGVEDTDDRVAVAVRKLGHPTISPT